MIKKLSVSLGLIAVSLILISCARITPKITSEPVTKYWGTKQEVINFLQSPKAAADRWLLEAL